MASVEKRGESYRIVVFDGYYPNGKQRTRKKTVKLDPNLTQKKITDELERQKVLFEEQVKKGQYYSSDMRFSEYAEIWIKNYGERQLAPKTLERYKALLVRINDAIGNIPLVKLQPHNINEFIMNLEEGKREDTKFIAVVDLKELSKIHGMTRVKLAEQSGVTESTIYAAFRGQGVRKETAIAICKTLKIKIKDTFVEKGGNVKLAPRTVLHYFRLISTILNAAVKDDQIIDSNPADRTRPPHSVRKEAEYLDDIQSIHLLELLEEEPIKYTTAIILLLFLGLRRGELLGLEWSDINFSNRKVSIHCTSQYIAGKGIITKEPKTSSSVRTIKLSNICFDQLQTYRVWQDEQRLSFGNQWHETNRLFTTWNGLPMHPDSLSGWFKDFIKRSGLPNIHLHSLRHTNATLMIASGIDIRTVSRRLGHAQTSTTMNIYTHAIQSADAKAADKLEDMLSPKGKVIPFRAKQISEG
ncbi:MAG TPA: tyrosine-type recombinase/integrase [Oscillospiraceae bacterium]|nr:tyrosine-type recombinase/integrase [Oscillospiraceae bacterium]